MSLLAVRDLRAGYERLPVIFGIDLAVDDSEIVAILGANGAGKTTTLRCLSGMLRPMAGRIEFAGNDITVDGADAVARAGLIHVPEGRGIFPTLAVQESLQLAAAVARVRGDEIADRIDEMYGIFPRLGERRAQLAGTLSGGEQQMLALARAMIVRPRLLLIDEMSQGLAPTIVGQLFELVAGFPARGTAVLLVEQFVGQALKVASRAYVLEKGMVAFAGETAVLAANQDFVRSSYLGSSDDGADGEDPAAPVPATLAENVTVALPPTLLRSLSERATREGVAVSDLIERALRGELVDETPDQQPVVGARR